MTPQVFVITCFDKETDNFEELSGAFVKRKLAEDAKKNLDINFPQFEHRIKVLSLQDIRLSKLSVAFIVYANKLENASVQIKNESQRLIALAKKYPTSVESQNVFIL